MEQLSVRGSGSSGLFFALGGSPNPKRRLPQREGGGKKRREIEREEWEEGGEGGKRKGQIYRRWLTGKKGGEKRTFPFWKKYSVVVLYYTGYTWGRISAPACQRDIRCARSTVRMMSGGGGHSHRHDDDDMQLDLAAKGKHCLDERRRPSSSFFPRRSVRRSSFI